MEGMRILGISSVAALIAATGLFIGSNNYNKQCGAYTAEMGVKYPAIVKVDALEKASSNLYEGSRELTYYCEKPLQIIPCGKSFIVSPAIYHHPSVQDSRGQLANADLTLEPIVAKDSKDLFYTGSKIEELTDEIKSADARLSVQKDGQDESHYVANKEEIESIEANARQELARQKGIVPKEVLGKRDSLKSARAWTMGSGIFLGIGGLIGAGISGLDWYENRDYY